MSNTSPTVADKIKILEKFNRRVRKAEQGGFFERVGLPWGVNVVTNTIEAITGGHAWRLDFDGPNDTDITAFATDFGFFEKGRDDTTLFQIAKLYTLLHANDCIPQSTLDAFRAIRAALSAYWGGPSPVQIVDFTQAYVGPGGLKLIGDSGEPVKGLVRPLTNGDTMGLFLYGYYLHENPKEAQVIDRWRSNNQLYALLLTIFLHILARSILMIRDVAEINIEALARLATLSASQRLPTSGCDPNPDIRLFSLDKDLLCLLATQDPGIAAPTIPQANGIYIFDF